MSTTYTIDFSEPTKQGFLIKSGSYNGPGGPESNTTLRLFGRSAREWGEAVDENMVRLLENFASASPPSSPITGQLWIQTSIYWRDTNNSNPLAGWYRYNQDKRVWELLAGTGIVSSSAMPVPTVGHYYTQNNVLYGYYTLGKYEPAKYSERASVRSAGVPTNQPPLQTLFVYDANANSGAGEWMPQSATTVTAGTAPPSARVGMLWYNTVTGNLSVWSGATWQNILGPTIAGGVSAASGNLNMNGYRVTNLGVPTAASDAITKQYLEQALIGATGSLGYLPLSGGTITGSLTVTAGITTSFLQINETAEIKRGLAIRAGGLNVGGNVYVNGGTTLDGALTVNGGIVFNAGAPGMILTGPANIQGTLFVASNATVSGTVSATTMVATGNMHSLGLITTNVDASNNVNAVSLSANGITIRPGGSAILGGGVSIAGNLNMNGAGIFNVNMSGDSLGAANKAYVDSRYNELVTYANNKGNVVSTGGGIEGNGLPANAVRINYAEMFAQSFRQGQMLVRDLGTGAQYYVNTGLSNMSNDQLMWLWHSIQVARFGYFPVGTPPSGNPIGDPSPGS